MDKKEKREDLIGIELGENIIMDSCKSGRMDIPKIDDDFTKSRDSFYDDFIWKDITKEEEE